MKTIPLGRSQLVSSRLGFGCWRLVDSRAGQPSGPAAAERARAAVLAAYEAGYTLFDHADIYGEGEPERIFGQVLREVPGMRQRVVIVTKCGIRRAGEPTPEAPYRYDFSAEHILRSVEGSLRRLGIETIDVLLLHRPDYLMDPAEVAAAFDQLKRSGKVREFGVSNFRPSQLAALQRACPMPLIVHQVEISLANLTCLEDGTLDQCLEQHITPMAWSPLAGGLLGQGAHRLLPAQQVYRPERILPVLDQLAAAHQASRAVIALAWLLRHPAGILPIIGSTEPGRIAEAARAADLQLSREEWYRLLEAAKGQRLP